jgi:hypothetical protein
MSYFHDNQQQNAQQFPQQWGTVNPGMLNPAMSQAYGQPQFGQQFGQPNLNAFGQNVGWGMQRQLSQQDVGDVVRQLVPLLPQILSQAQSLPTMAYGYGQPQRLLSQQDVNEVVRQILPVVPQIAALLQGQPTAAAAVYGAQGQQNPWAHTMHGQNPFAQNPWAQGSFTAQNPYAQTPIAQWSQQPFAQQGAFQSAFGGAANWNPLQQRTLTPNDVNEVVRQLVAIIPQAIANLQAFNQQRVI